MKSLLALPVLLFLLREAEAFRFVSKVEELPVEVSDRLEIIRPKVRLCGGDSEEESTDCVLCTVCHPHEYELIGCSGQIDSVCASCTTGWLRSTPKTIDFFRKCKKHPQLPFLFPEIPRQIRLDTQPSSMFSDQEKMLQDAENTETAEMSEELSDEDDYDGEEEEEDEDGQETVNVGEEDVEEDESQEIGVQPVEVDERDDGFDMSEEEQDSFYPRTAYQFHKELEHMIAENMNKEEASEEASSLFNDRFVYEDSEEVKEEERADPFDSKAEKVEEEDEDEESTEVLVYPLHRANIWRIIGPELGRADDKDITKEMKMAISERKRKWQLQKIMRRRRVDMSSDEIGETEALNSHVELKGGYRPMPVRIGQATDASLVDSFINLPPIVGALCFALLGLCILFTIKICFVRRRRNRVIILPELDEMSRQLINEAHARVHSKKEKKIRPEFV